MAAINLGEHGKTNSKAFLKKNEGGGKLGWQSDALIRDVDDRKSEMMGMAKNGNNPA